MGGDMVAALGRATVDGHTLFGHNCRRPGGDVLLLHRSIGRDHAPEEKLETSGGIVPQARQTFTAVGVQSTGRWGYHHGVNVWGVAAGCTMLRTRLACGSAGLHGTDLVRLVLERARTARQAVDLLGDLVSRHGQRFDADADCAFLIVDAREAFVVETAGRFWAYQEVREARAVSEVCTIRQDWDGIAPGLASLAIANQWWPADGSKVDFGGIVAPAIEKGDSPLISAASAAAFRRWGRATLLLEQQNGHIDLAFIRRLLSDHFEDSPDEADPLHPSAEVSPLCLHGATPDAPMTGSSLVVQLDGTGRAMAWCCPGPPCTGVYLPVLLAGDPGEVYGSAATRGFARMRRLPVPVGDNLTLRDLARDSLGRLQARLDLETEEFAAWTDPGVGESQQEQSRRATLFMRHALERLEETVDGLLAQRPTRPRTTTRGVTIHP